jgi:hypothetical protein
MKQFLKFRQDPVLTLPVTLSYIISTYYVNNGKQVYIASPYNLDSIKSQKAAQKSPLSIIFKFLHS